MTDSADRPRLLEQVIETTLTLGLVVSGGVLVWGLVFGSTRALWWGVLILMCTPVVRVVVVTIGLVLRRDWVFGLVSFWVLAVLLSGIHVAARF